MDGDPAVVERVPALQHRHLLDLVPAGADPFVADSQPDPDVVGDQHVPDRQRPGAHHSQYGERCRGEPAQYAGRRTGGRGGEADGHQRGPERDPAVHLLRGTDRERDRSVVEVETLVNWLMMCHGARFGHGHSPRRVVMKSSRSSGLTRTSRALDPSLGPTTPRLSRMSISRPALAKPTRSLRCSIDVEPNWVETISSAAWITRSMSSPISSSRSLLGAATAVTSSRYVGSSCVLVCSTTARISDSVTHDPWIRIGLLAPIGRNRPSPCPPSFSAPGWAWIPRPSASDQHPDRSPDGPPA